MFFRLYGCVEYYGLRMRSMEFCARSSGFDASGVRLSRVWRPVVTVLKTHHSPSLPFRHAAEMHCCVIESRWGFLCLTWKM